MGRTLDQNEGKNQGRINAIGSDPHAINALKNMVPGGGPE
jgi:hypothetical protein